MTHEAINKAVHEKLGRVGESPDYTHDISAAWAIKEWLDEHGQEAKHRFECELFWGKSHGYPCWASPLDRCKAFLLMKGWL